MDDREESLGKRKDPEEKEGDMLVFLEEEEEAEEGG